MCIILSFRLKADKNTNYIVILIQIHVNFIRKHQFAGKSRTLKSSAENHQVTRGNSQMRKVVHPYGISSTVSRESALCDKRPLYIRERLILNGMGPVSPLYNVQSFILVAFAVKVIGAPFCDQYQLPLSFSRSTCSVKCFSGSMEAINMKA